MRNLVPQLISSQFKDKGEVADPAKELRLANYRRAIRLYLQQVAEADIATATSLSMPTVGKLIKRFKSGGWKALETLSTGRPKTALQDSDPVRYKQILAGLRIGYDRKDSSGLEPEQKENLLLKVWRRADAAAVLSEFLGKQVSERELGRWLHQARLTFDNLNELKTLVKQTQERGRLPERVYQLDRYRPPEAAKARRKMAKNWISQQDRLLQGQKNRQLLIGLVRAIHPQCYQLCIQLPGREQLWFTSMTWPTQSWLVQCLQALTEDLPQPFTLWLYGLDLTFVQRPEKAKLNGWLTAHSEHVKLDVIPPLLGELLYRKQL